jgi:glycogen synthase
MDNENDEIPISENREDVQKIEWKTNSEVSGEACKVSEHNNTDRSCEDNSELAKTNNFVEEINSMCRSFVNHFFEVENYSGHFDIIHAHDWLASNSALWIKEGRQKKTILTIHSTEYGRCGNHFHGGQSAMVRENERNATNNVDRVIAVSNALKKEVMWMYNIPDEKMKSVKLAAEDVKKCLSDIVEDVDLSKYIL